MIDELAYVTTVPLATKIFGSLIIEIKPCAWI